MIKQYKGYILVILSGIIYGLMPLAAKLVYLDGSNPISLVLYRNLFCIPFLYVVLKSRYSIGLNLSKLELKNVVVLATLGGIVTPMLLFSSYNHITTGAATTVHFIYPVIVFIMGIVFYKEKVDIMKLLCVASCFFGIMLFYTPSIENSLLGLVLSFLSGLTYAFYIVFLDKSGLKKMNPVKLTLCICTYNSIMLLIFTLYTKSFTVLQTPRGWVVAVLLSLFINFVAIIPFQLGVAIIGSQKSAILSTFEPITSVIIAILFLNEKINIRSILGVIIILFSVIALIIFDDGHSSLVDT